MDIAVSPEVTTVQGQWSDVTGGKSVDLEVSKINDDGFATVKDQGRVINIDARLAKSANDWWQAQPGTDVIDQQLNTVFAPRPGVTNVAGVTVTTTIQ